MVYKFRATDPSTAAVTRATEVRLMALILSLNMSVEVLVLPKQVILRQALTSAGFDPVT